MRRTRSRGLAPGIPAAAPLQPSASEWGTLGADIPPLQGSPMRRTRSRGLAPALPMSSSFSGGLGELVSSFGVSAPSDAGGMHGGDVLDGW